MSRLHYRLATTENGLATGHLFVWQLPPPTTATYRDHSQKFPQSDGGEARHGFRSVELTWNTLTPAQAYTIRRMVVTVLSAGNPLYLTINRADGTRPGNDWIDVFGRPRIPDIEPEGSIAGASGFYHRNVTLFVNNLTIVNDPAEL